MDGKFCVSYNYELVDICNKRRVDDFNFIDHIEHSNNKSSVGKSCEKFENGIDISDFVISDFKNKKYYVTSDRIYIKHRCVALLAVRQALVLLVLYSASRKLWKHRYIFCVCSVTVATLLINNGELLMNHSLMPFIINCSSHSFLFLFQFRYLLSCGIIILLKTINAAQNRIHFKPNTVTWYSCFACCNISF